MRSDCCTTETREKTPVNVAEAPAVDPINALPTAQDDPRHACRGCSGASHPVTRKTVLLMLRPELLDHVGGGEYRFCSEPECRIVYFNEEDDTIFTTGGLRVRVGLKEQLDPIPLCYCFGFEESDAREEIMRIGASTIPQRIAALIRQKMCACPAKNPSGACCLGDVNKAIKRLMAEAVEVR